MTSNISWGSTTTYSSSGTVTRTATPTFTPENAPGGTVRTYGSGGVTERARPHFTPENAPNGWTTTYSTKTGGVTKTPNTSSTSGNTPNSKSSDLGSVDNFMKKQRSKNVSQNEELSKIVSGEWKNSEGYEWRVRLTLPDMSPFTSSNILYPLYETDNSMIWPYTPSIIITHSASYNTVSPTHNNYSYPSYQNSSVEQMTITGGFSVENPYDAEYWIAATHFLRSITKMFYGESENAGAPPPVIKLYGYGDHVLGGIPVIIESFVMNLPDDVDYIKANVGSNGSWVPTYSDISVTARVAYSRDAVNKFNLDTFVNGGYLGTSNTRFI